MEENKKDLRAQKKSGTSNFEIKYNGGGELPADLQGEFTSESRAKAAIAAYLDKKNRNVSSKNK